MKDDYDFQLWVRVFDPEGLRTAACAHEDADPSDTFTEEGEVDVEPSLVMLLDPGALDGCSIYESSATAVSHISAGTYKFNMSLSVHDLKRLREAALRHEDAQPDDTFLTEEGAIDIEACLCMLLDPGSLSGCSISSSSASYAGLLLDDEEGEEDRLGMVPG